MNVNIGRVVGTLNPQNENVLEIIPYGVEHIETIQAIYGTPFGGAGYGMVATPSKGSLVLYVDVLDLVDVPFGYVWFSCVFDPMHPQMVDTHTEIDQQNPEGVARVQVDKSSGSSTEKLATINPIPENTLLFADDGHNDSFLLKSKTGHRFKMAHKVTSQRCEDHIELSTAGNKRLVFDDGHQDGIFMQDDKAKDPNRREIFTGEDKIRDYAGKDIESISREGSHTTSILDGKGSIYRENQADGDVIDIVYGNGKEEKGNYLLDAHYNVSSFSRTGDILQSCDEGNTTQYTKLDHAITVDANAITTIAEDYTLTVGGNMDTSVTGDSSLSVVGSITITTSSFLDISASTTISIDAGAGLDMTAGGNMNIHSNGPMVISSNAGIIIQAPRVDII